MRCIASAALLTLLVLAGCGGSSNVDTAKIEHGLQARVAADAKIDPFKVSIDCPSNVPAEQGRTFTCTVSYEKVRRTIDVRLEANKAYSAVIRTQTTP